MKITLFVLFVLCASIAFGQSAPVANPQGQMPVLFDHPEHAVRHAMADERPIVGGAPDAYTYAHGERPLWEFGPMVEPTPLGDVARAYRREKLAAKKAEIVFEKQGS